MNNDLVDITKKLGQAHAESKKWDKIKSECRLEFFKEISSQHQVLAEKIIFVEAKNLAEATQLADKHHPTWTALSAVQVDGGFDVRIKENPEYAPFSFINEEDGMVYQKQVVSGPVMFDDERFKEDHPDLYHVVTHIPEPKRELRPLEDLSDEQINILQEYVYEGKPVIKLAAPRKAKEDEL